MTILEMIADLLELHGIDGRRFDRIDVALDALYKAEMNEKKRTQTAPEPERKQSKKKASAVEEHVGI